MIRSSKCQVAAEIEATEGTAETLEAADAFLVFNAAFDPDVAMNERKPLKGRFGASLSVPGKRMAKMTFDVELVGTSSAGSAVHFADALKACGVAETLVASTSATYKPTSNSVSSVTLAMYVDGKRYMMWGARGTAKLTLESGKPGMLHFEFTGADWSVADVALLSGVSYNSVIPPVFQDVTFTIDSYAAQIAKIDIDFGNTVTLRSDITTPSGYLSAMITDRKAAMTIDPEEVLSATEDFWANLRSGALMAMSAAMGSVAGNTITLTAPKVQYQKIGMTQREGMEVLNINCLLVENTGDDEWQIAIT